MCAQPVVEASAIATGPIDVSYVTGRGASFVIQVGGSGAQPGTGIRLELGSLEPTQLRLYLIPREGPSRYRYVALTRGRLRRTLELPVEAFDPDPQVVPGRVPDGGALLVVDAPGFMRTRLENVLSVGPLTISRRPAPMPPDQRAPEPEASPDPVLERIRAGWLGKAAGCRLGMPREGRLETAWDEVAALERGYSDPAVWGFGPDDDTTLMVVSLLVHEGLAEEGLAGDRHAGGLAGDRHVAVAGVARDRHEEAGREAGGEAGDRCAARRPGARGAVLLAGLPDAIVRAWRDELAHEYLWKTGRRTLEEVRAGIDPLRCGTGPRGESLCARIRADLWGLVRPGRPGEAMALAARDAPLTNHGVAVQSALFFAAAVSLAFEGGRPEALVRKVLDLRRRDAPEHSAIVARCLELFDGGTPVELSHRVIREELFEPVHRRDPEHSWVHVVPNDAAVILALLHGRGDWGRTVALAVAMGWDTDCNAGTAGLILGVLAGPETIPPRFREPLHDRLRVAIPGREHWSVAELARRTREAGRRDPGPAPAPGGP